MSRTRWRRPLAVSLHEQLEDNGWEYLMFRVHPTHRQLCRSYVHVVKHRVKSLPNPPVTTRPRWRRPLVSWRAVRDG